MGDKYRAFELFSQGKRPSDNEVKSLKLKNKTLYNYYQEWKKLPGTGQHVGPVKSTFTNINIPRQTDAVSQATSLNFMLQTLSLPLTPNIHTSYMCALKYGYKGDLGDWLNLVADDFWTGRKIDYYLVMSGIDSSTKE